MDFPKTSSGTRGSRTPTPPKALDRFIRRQMVKYHRRKGDTFMGIDVLYLTTVGAKSGEKRMTPVARFPDGEGAWLIVASNAGAARNPGWYHNIAAQPNNVWIEVGGRHQLVAVEQLEGARREEAWQQIIAAQPRYATFQQKTDRELPIIRLMPADWGVST